jgi:hypothetical protein
MCNLNNSNSLFPCILLKCLLLVQLGVAILGVAKLGVAAGNWRSNYLVLLQLGAAPTGCGITGRGFNWVRQLLGAATTGRSYNWVWLNWVWLQLAQQLLGAAPTGCGIT